MGGLLSFLVLCGCLWSQISFAKGISEIEGFFEVEPGISLYAHLHPGAPDAPVIVLLNGLTQDLDHWKTSIPYLQKMNATIVSIDLALQGRSMVKRLKESFTFYNPVLPPLVMKGGLWDLPPTFKAIPVENQARYVSKLLPMLGISKPVTLLGLSYGGGLALQMAADYPDQINSAILAAPYAFPLPDLDSVIRMLANYTQNANPVWRLVSYDDVYDLFLRAIVFWTYPSAEPEVMKWSPPFQAIAASELVRGIRHMSYENLFERLKVPLHLVIAGEDKYIPRDKLDEFWSQVPSRFKGSSIEIAGVEHKMNESVGPFLASWAWEVATNPDYLKHPGQFKGIPQDGVATEIGGPRIVKLEKTNPCQDFLAGEVWQENLDKIRKDPAASATMLMSKGNPLPIP